MHPACELGILASFGDVNNAARNKARRGWRKSSRTPWPLFSAWSTGNFQYHGVFYIQL